jgi:hypothetical protein
MSKHFNPEGNRLQLVYSLCYDKQAETLFFPLGINYYQNIPSDERNSKCACISLDLLLFQLAIWIILKREKYE